MRLFQSLFIGLLVLLSVSLTACGSAGARVKPTSTLVPVVLPSETPALCAMANGSRVVCSTIRQVIANTPTPQPTVNAPIKSTTGIVNAVKESADKKSITLTITPDDPQSVSSFTISDWSRVSVYFYWEGFQTPSPVSNGNAVVTQNSLNHRVTIGYYATTPPMVVMVSMHKQKGDSQK